MTLVWHEMVPFTNVSDWVRWKAGEWVVAETEMVERVRHIASPRARQVRCIREDGKKHVGGTEDAPAVVQ